MNTSSPATIMRRRWTHYLLLLILAWFGGTGIFILWGSVVEFTRHLQGWTHLFLGVFCVATGVVALYAFVRSWFRPVYLSLGLLFVQPLANATTRLIQGRESSLLFDVAVSVVGLSLITYAFIGRRTPPEHYSDA